MTGLDRAPGGERSGGRFSALRNRDFALFWGAHVVSRMGTQMRDVALAWHLYVLTRSPLQVGLLGACRVAPILVLALVGGAAADAFDRRRVMLATQTVMALTSAGMAVATHTGAVSAPVLYALVAAAGAVTAFDNPARQSLNVSLLPKRDLPNGLALGIVGWQAATVAGPAIGGILIAALPLETIYWIDAASFATVIGALFVVRPHEPVPGAEAPPRSEVSVRAVADGLRFLRTKPLLVWLMVVDFLATFFAGSLLLLPFFANEIFHVGPRGLGFLAAAPAVGALLASGWLSWRPPIERQGVAVLGAIAVYGVVVAGFGLTRSFWLALVLLAASGACDTVSTVVRQVVRHTSTPDAMRGRMTAMNMMFFVSGPQLGEVEAGAVAQWTSARVSVVSGGAACIVVAVVVALAVPALRALRRDPTPA